MSEDKPTIEAKRRRPGGAAAAGKYIVEDLDGNAQTSFVPVTVR